MVDELFALHEASLIASWRLLAAADPAAAVVDDVGAVTMTHPHPALCNALLRSPAGLGRIRRLYGGRHHAVWVRDPYPALDAALAAAGYRRDERTVPMVLDLRQEPAADSTAEVVQVDPAGVAEHSGVGRAMLAGVPHAYGHATAGWESWAVTVLTGAVANVSFVGTRAEFRRRGLARAVVARALRDARGRGATHATLQSTAEAVGLYRGLGFRDAGAWQEWVAGGAVSAWGGP
ncbi:GNAT family N-acetyltransferase [Spirilliplanes yamanashiensis]|uniref:N-acetyltransferase domain-containing protein n=1 Tax=Spirilliplanes yamanashiensis TaxID=42233 RepID=A0A8J4DJW2_9ACTN|nr:GNAT family N-acetyltransferase [Spirilliplanes yamanashiensis]MDP9816940.1 ribosomal protein S18 acetylase RimI-like enzyme [Spirilliplanes yamanashiensis]GIJ03405.1 hypothetical protein Sya03_27570 [Spirilliplanes yamanashiensis]